MHAGFFSFHSSRATIRWLKTESDDIWMFGSPWISGGEPQHCPLSFSPILTETVCTVKCGSPGEIKPHHQLHPSLQDDSLSLMPSIFFCLKKKKKHWIFLSPFSPCSNPSSHISTFFFSFFLPTSTNRLIRTSGLSEEPPENVWHDVFRSPEQRAPAAPTPAQFKLFSSSWGIPCQGATANSVSSSEVSR